MKKFILAVITLAAIGGASSLATAQSPAAASPTPSVAATPTPTNATDPTSLTAALLADVSAGKWVMAFAVLILLIVYYARTYVFQAQLGSGAYPWMSIGLGIVFAIASSVIGGMPAAAAVKIALLSGPAASTLWSSILKLVVSKA